MSNKPEDPIEQTVILDSILNKNSKASISKRNIKLPSYAKETKKEPIKNNVPNNIVEFDIAKKQSTARNSKRTLHINIGKTEKSETTSAAIEPIDETPKQVSNFEQNNPVINVEKEVITEELPKIEEHSNVQFENKIKENKNRQFVILENIPNETHSHKAEPKKPVINLNSSFFYTPSVFQKYDIEITETDLPKTKSVYEKNKDLKESLKQELKEELREELKQELKEKNSDVTIIAKKVIVDKKTPSLNDLITIDDGSESIDSILNSHFENSEEENTITDSTTEIPVQMETPAEPNPIHEGAVSTVDLNSSKNTISEAASSVFKNFTYEKSNSVENNVQVQPVNTFVEAAGTINPENSTSTPIINSIVTPTVEAQSIDLAEPIIDTNLINKTSTEPSLNIESIVTNIENPVINQEVIEENQSNPTINIGFSPKKDIDDDFKNELYDELQGNLDLFDIPMLDELVDDNASIEFDSIEETSSNIETVSEENIVNSENYEELENKFEENSTDIDDVETEITEENDVVEDNIQNDIESEVEISEEDINLESDSNIEIEEELPSSDIEDNEEMNEIEVEPNEFLDSLEATNEFEDNEEVVIEPEVIEEDSISDIQSESIDEELLLFAESSILDELEDDDEDIEFDSEINNGLPKPEIEKENDEISLEDITLEDLAGFNNIELPNEVENSLIEENNVSAEEPSIDDISIEDLDIDDISLEDIDEPLSIEDILSNSLSSNENSDMQEKLLSEIIEENEDISEDKNSSDLSKIVSSLSDTISDVEQEHLEEQKKAINILIDKDDIFSISILNETYEIVADFDGISVLSENIHISTPKKNFFVKIGKKFIDIHNYKTYFLVHTNFEDVEFANAINNVAFAKKNNKIELNIKEAFKLASANNKVELSMLNSSIADIANSSNTNTSTNNEESSVCDNKTLIISEETQKVYLPYTIEEVMRKLNNAELGYQTIEEVVEAEYVLPLSTFKMPIISRFKEAYRFMRTKEHSSVYAAIDLALELMFISNLNPAIIRASKDLKELNIYLDCLYENELDKFDCFKIIYKVVPIA